MDDLYDGWDGLPHLTDQLAGLLRPLARGEAGSYRRYDWHAGRYAETVAVPPGPLLVLEGVGLGLPGPCRPDHRAGLGRGAARAAAAARPGAGRRGARGTAGASGWPTRTLLFRREGIAERADLLVDGTGRARHPRRLADLLTPDVAHRRRTPP